MEENVRRLADRYAEFGLTERVKAILHCDEIHQCFLCKELR